MEKINDYYNGKTVLITGGAGAIGSNILKKLVNNCKKIIVIDDLSSGHLTNIPKSDNIIFLKESILKNKALEKAFSYDIDIVFHLAANFANQNSVDHPRKDLLVNGMGTLKMLQFSTKSAVEKFIFTSSSCIYGNSSQILTENNTDFNLDTPYAITKLLGEKYVAFFHEYYKLNTTTLRYFNSYGPGEFPGKYRNVIPNFLWYAIKKNPLPINGTGEETRDFTYVEDVVIGTLLSGKKKKALGEIINIGSGRETKIIDLANKINHITKNDAGIEFIKKRDWDSVLRRCASIKKAKNVLGYVPNIDLDEGLKKTFEWIKLTK